MSALPIWARWADVSEDRRADVGRHLQVQAKLALRVVEELRGPESAADHGAYLTTAAGYYAAAVVLGYRDLEFERRWEALAVELGKEAP